MGVCRHAARRFLLCLLLFADQLQGVLTSDASLPAARLQIKRLKAINATASFTMAGIYPMAKDYFSIYEPKNIK